MKLRKIQIPEPFGSEKVLKELSLGGDLAFEVRKYASSFENKVFTYAPDNIEESNLVTFDYGGLYLDQNNEATPWKIFSDALLRHELLSHLSNAADHWVILCNALANPTDKWIPHRQSKIVVYKKQVLHTLESPDMNQIDIALKEAAAAIPSLVFLLKESPRYSDGQTIDKSELSSIAAKVTTIILYGQYDGESFLIQYRNNC